MIKSIDKRKVLYFDGVCNLCNTFVDFMIRRQKTPIIYFAPLQGATAQEALGKEKASELHTVVYVENGQIHLRSSAALRAMADLGGSWKLVSVLLLLPRFVRDPIYLWVAKNRYRWFGKKDICRLPTAAEKQFFLP